MRSSHVDGCGPYPLYICDCTAHTCDTDLEEESIYWYHGHGFVFSPSAQKWFFFGGRKEYSSESTEEVWSRSLTDCWRRMMDMPQGLENFPCILITPSLENSSKGKRRDFVLIVKKSYFWVFDVKNNSWIWPKFRFESSGTGCGQCLVWDEKRGNIHYIDGEGDHWRFEGVEEWLGTL